MVDCFSRQLASSRTLPSFRDLHARRQPAEQVRGDRFRSWEERASDQQLERGQRPVVRLHILTRQLCPSACSPITRSQKGERCGEVFAHTVRASPGSHRCRFCTRDEDSRAGEGQGRSVGDQCGGSAATCQIIKRVGHWIALVAATNVCPNAC